MLLQCKSCNVFALTCNQSKVLEFLKTHIEKNGYAPTLVEIKNGLGLSSHNSSAQYLNALEKKGYIYRQPNASRAIRIL